MFNTQANGGMAFIRFHPDRVTTKVRPSKLLREHVPLPLFF